MPALFPRPFRHPALAAAALLLAPALRAQAPAPSAATGVAAGAFADAKVLTLDGTRRILAASEAEAKRNGWRMCVVIADPAGEPLAMMRMDSVPVGTCDVAAQKAQTAARFGRGTDFWGGSYSRGATVLLGVRGMLPVTGGVPVLVNGVVAAAVGVSGASAAQDAQVAQAGIAAVVPPAPATAP